jgi:cell division protein FtsB
VWPKKGQSPLRNQLEGYKQLARDATAQAHALELETEISELKTENVQLKSEISGLKTEMKQWGAEIRKASFIPSVTLRG